MKLLFLGGTQFVGRHLVNEAIARGHEVTLFSRGQTNPDLFSKEPLVTKVAGDRKESLRPLGDGPWDAVVDCVGYWPADVAKSAEYLKGKTSAYLFISTVSVYPGGEEPFDETGPVLLLPESASKDTITGENYGALKALCEEEVKRFFPVQHMMARAGLQVGPYDHTDRFGDWIERIGARQAVIVPSGKPIRWPQIDSRDMAAFLVDSLEVGRYGTYNLTGPAQPMNDVLEVVKAEVNQECDLVEVDANWLLEKGVEPWGELTLWLPADQRQDFPVANVTKALNAGMKLRPLEETVRDAWAWLKTLPKDRARRGGLASEKEDALLAELGV